MTQKAARRPAGTAAEPRETANEFGRLGVDDRGNITWQWREDRKLLADDTSGAEHRLRALVDPGLDLAAEDQPSDRFNPYDSFSGTGTDEQAPRRKKKNLRELSRWIELRKKMAAKKDE
jgi:hypothetical protein